MFWFAGNLKGLASPETDLESRFHFIAYLGITLEQTKSQVKICHNDTY